MGMFAPPRPTDVLWSPDGKFVALPVYSMELSLVNLQTDQSTNLAIVLPSEIVPLPSYEFRSWSPDSSKLGFVISAEIFRPNRATFAESDLFSLDRTTLRATYTATMRKKSGWRVGEFIWVENAEGFELAIHPDLRNSLTVFHKSPSSLPKFVSK